MVGGGDGGVKPILVLSLGFDQAEQLPYEEDKSSALKALYLIKVVWK